MTTHEVQQEHATATASQPRAGTCYFTDLTDATRYCGPVWFSFFLTSFSENLAAGRIWLWGESEYYYDYV
jgi:hypothetical protein